MFLIPVRLRSFMCCSSAVTVVVRVVANRKCPNVHSLFKTGLSHAQNGMRSQDCHAETGYRASEATIKAHKPGHFEDVIVRFLLNFAAPVPG